MAFFAAIDRQLEIQLAGSYRKIGHHTAWHHDAQVPLIDCLLWIKRNIMKHRLMSFVLCALDVAVMKTWKKPSDHFLVNSHNMCCAGGNLGLGHWDLLRSYISVDPPQNSAHVCTQQLILKLPPFFSSPFACLRVSEVVLFLQWGYRLMDMVSIAWTCPLHNCSHLGKAVVKPSTVLKSPGLLHNSAPKFGLSFTG